MNLNDFSGTNRLLVQYHGKILEFGAGTGFLVLLAGSEKYELANARILGIFSG
jgi:hypothetical protein